jgi:hypothetical protein
MLKKIIHIMLSSLLFFTTMGMVVSKHYCQGNLYSVSIDGLNNDKCDMGNCCHDETHFFKVQEDFSQPQIINTPDVAGFDLFFVAINPFISDLFAEEELKNQFIDYSPPLPLDIQTSLSKKQTYLL